MKPALTGHCHRHQPALTFSGQTSSRFDILEEIEIAAWLPIVLHGASSVIPEFVQMINENGGAMPDAIGIRDMPASR